nr:hypothetical protein [Micromonospora sp. DSM 115978]
MPATTIPIRPPTRTVGVELASASIARMLTDRERQRADRDPLYAAVLRTRRRAAVVATAGRVDLLARPAAEIAHAYAATLVSEPPPQADPRVTAVCHCGATIRREIAMVGDHAVPWWIHSGAVHGTPHAARPELAVSA